jgi:hypothetical protein
MTIYLQYNCFTFSHNVDLNKPFSMLSGLYTCPVSYRNLGQDLSETTNCGCRLRIFFLTLTSVNGIHVRKAKHLLGVIPIVLDGTEQTSSYIMINAMVQLQAWQNRRDDRSVKVCEPNDNLFLEAGSIIAASTITAFSQLKPIREGCFMIAGDWQHTSLKIDSSSAGLLPVNLGLIHEKKSRNSWKPW